ncbi:HlyD family secretion protein [Deinococcus sp. HSC-46F16]|uniref:efflux RND transporter periplasmic adaptor subunit n=1 Tax=Deinococcus sp. HSC-46F16 TaxID=2910968 RepID=UPI0020A07153|nr:efflux RND transporter periplasmic adaptor subunit [Deinococcus sp. HSC-46F16]MCP2014639.1 HlyD family secretion protein [Deinococcus sp. HSC-46F16]
MAPTTTTSSTTVTRPARRRRRWPWVLTGLLLLGAGGGVWYSRTRGAEAEAPAVTTQLQPVQPGTVRVSVSGPGTLEAAATRTVGVSRNVTVGTLPAVGERVTKGQLLTTLTSDDVTTAVRTAELNLQKARASLDALRASQEASRVNQQSSAAQADASVTAAQATLADAERTLASARTTLNAQEQLYAVGAVSAQDLAAARNAVADAQAGVQSARSSLESARTSAAGTRQQAQASTESSAQDLRSSQLAVQQAEESLEAAQADQAALKIYAPISGVVSAVGATEGAPLASNSTLLTLLDDTTLNLPVQVDETEIGGVEAGQPAEVTLDAREDQTFRGEVVRVSPGATQESGISVFTATVTLDNADGLLRPGMTAEAEIIQSEASGLLVPARAIQTVRGRSYVQMPGEEGAEPERVRVTLGATDGTNTIVEEGLTPGQQVVVPGSRSAAPASSGQPRQGQGGFGAAGGPPGGFGGAP